jgi:NAD-dependent dihydropyrimidine dehydrogenase PreA subunit
MFRPTIEEDRCTKCRECEKICPKKVFESDDSEVKVYDPIKCTGCESCVVVCPMKALKVEES